jgi:hypothetical protein
LLVVQLDEYFAALEKSRAALDYSHDNCNAIGENGEYDPEQQESFEALNSRFARTSDILTQKVFKALPIFQIQSFKRSDEATKNNKKPSFFFLVN